MIRVPQSFSCSHQRGFTLVEMIIVIVLLGIIAGIVAAFIRLPIAGYVDTVARADIVDTGDTALRRIARDVRLALPNSVRVTTDASGNQYLELLLTRTGGRYLALEDNPNTTAPIGHPLSFTDATATTFDIVGPAPSGAQTIQIGDSIVVYNLGPGLSPADAYAAPATNSAVVSSITATGNVTTIGMAGNPFATQSPSMPSPYHRFQAVVGPVTYRWDSVALTLTRYWNYKLSETQPNSLIALSAGGNSALMATGVNSPCATGASSTCVFTYVVAQQTNALLEVSINLTAPTTDTGHGGTIGLFQQIHVDNTP
jgi:MSHA biogenesis protein MshO